MDIGDTLKNGDRSVVQIQEPNVNQCQISGWLCDHRKGRRHTTSINIPVSFLKKFGHFEKHFEYIDIDVSKVFSESLKKIFFPAQINVI